MRNVDSNVIHLLDVSANQKAIDWDKVVAAGYSAVMVKASEGVNYEDPMCKPHCAGARAAGLKVGVYHYLRVRDRQQDALKQVDQYQDIWERERCDLLPCLDVETAFNDQGMSPDPVSGLYPRAICIAFNEATGEAVDGSVTRSGFYPLIYTSPGECRALNLGSVEQLRGCPLWVASYTPTAPTPPYPWATFVAWQHTGAGKIPGLPGVYDLSCAPSLDPLLV